MSGSINTTGMVAAATNVDPNPLAFDHEERKLAIIYGTFATLIAFSSLVFAALTWCLPRRPRFPAQLVASVEYDLESMMPRHKSHVVQASQSDSRPMISPPAKVLSRSDLDAIVTKLSRPHTNSDRDREDLQREDKCEGVGYECMSSVRKGFQENFGTEDNRPSLSPSPSGEGKDANSLE